MKPAAERGAKQMDPAEVSSLVMCEISNQDGGTKALQERSTSRDGTVRNSVPTPHVDHLRLNLAVQEWKLACRRGRTVA